MNNKLLIKTSQNTKYLLILDKINQRLARGISLSSMKRGKFGKPDFDFEDDSDCSLDQILDSLSQKFSEPQPPNEEKPTPQRYTAQVYQHKISETLDDIIKIEQNACQNIISDIDELSTPSKVREYAEKYYLSEYNAKEELRNNLIGQLKSWGLNCIDKQHYPLPREIKHIIRMDFYGTVKKPDEQKLSDTYRRRNPSNTKDLTAKNYDLKQSPTWMVFRQFKSFRLLEKILKEKLIENGITPEQAKRLNPYDYSDILFNHFVTKRRRDGVESHNASIFLGARQRFIKKFIQTHEVAFRNYLKMAGTDERYTEVLIHHMRTKGLTGNVEVIDQTFNEQQLKFFKARKLISNDTKVGDKITDNHIRKIRDAKLINEILTKGEDGKPITGPTLSVHHKVAVKDSGEKTNFSEVNLFKNLCLMVEPYHDIAHSLDKTKETNGGESYVSRIELEEDVIFYGGFNKIFQIYQHFDTTQKINSDEMILKNYQNQSGFSTEEDLTRKKTSWRKEKKVQKNLKKKLKKGFSVEEAKRIVKEVTDNKPVDDTLTPQPKAEIGRAHV